MSRLTVCRHDDETEMDSYLAGIIEMDSCLFGIQKHILILLVYLHEQAPRQPISICSSTVHGLDTAYRPRTCHCLPHDLIVPELPRKSCALARAVMSVVDHCAVRQMRDV